MSENATSSMVQIGMLSSDRGQEDLWIAASQKGDAQAFNNLVLKWEKNIYNLGLRVLQDREEAAEAAQEIFLLAFRNIRRFRRDARFSTWLYRIAINCCLTRLSQRPPGIKVSLDSELKQIPLLMLQLTQSPDADLLRAERHSSVMAALSRLSPEQQAVIELKFFQEQTFDDIAAILQIPVGTVKSRLYSGLEILKTKLRSQID
jgi:RNA polymerase sigma-70 factor, ECF subfamily